MKRVMLMGMTVLVLLCLAGCGNKAEDAVAYQAVYDDLAGVLMVMEANNAYYEAVLDATQNYVDNKTPENLEAAKKTAVDNMSAIVQSENVSSTLDEKTKKWMRKSKIDTVDYNVPFSTQDLTKNAYTQDITQLYYYLSNADKLSEELAENLSFKTKWQKNERMTTILGLNDLFCDVSEENLSYFKETVLKKLETINQDNIPWMDKRAAIEEKTDVIFAELEADLSTFEKYVNNQEIEALTEEKIKTNDLMAGGMTKEEAEKTMEALKALSEKALEEQMNLPLGAR